VDRNPYLVETPPHRPPAAATGPAVTTAPAEGTSERTARVPRPKLPPVLTDGLLLVDKPAGCTSHDVVQRLRRILRQKKIGHCGTLDPEATGLLLLTLGQATRLTRFLIRAPKVYEGTVQFGVTTDTYDAVGQVTARAATDGLTAEAVLAAMPALVGTYEQSPPPFCARKVGGVRFYELARRGEEVPETTKEVTVYELSPLGELEDAKLRFRLACSSGTYARSIAHDLGRALGCGGHLAALRRTKVGTFTLDRALTIDEIARRVEGEEPLGESWIPFDAIALPFAEVVLDATQERRVLHGQTALLREAVGEEGDWVKLATRRGRFLAVGTVRERIGTSVAVVQPKIVFSEGR
jgi:tRNA pseudouridine55 synthase